MYIAFSSIQAFADRELGRIYWTIPVFVAISVIGAQNVGVFTSSRQARVVFNSCETAPNREAI